MNGITFIKSNGGITAPLAGEDHISGMVFFADADHDINLIGSLETAEKIGITKEHEDKVIQVAHYHISEFFRMNPGASLFVGIFKKPANNKYDFLEVKKLQNFAEGKIRQCGVYAPEITISEDTSSAITTLQAVAKGLETDFSPLSIAVAFNVDDYKTLPSLVSTGNSNVSVVIGQDSTGTAKELFESTQKSITCLGLILGMLSKASVHESIAWVQKFPSGINTPALADGTPLYMLDNATLNLLDSKQYIFLRKHIGINGSFVNDSHTLDEPTSDYCTIEKVRTMDKATRGIRTYILPYLSSPLYVGIDGKLLPEDKAFLEGLAGKQLEDMERARELSGYKVEIDPNQDVISTSEVEFIISNIPVGVMRKVKVKIGFKTTL